MLIAAHNLVGHIVHTYRQILLLFSRNAAYYRSYLIKQAGQIHVGDIEYQPAAFYYAYIENIAYKAEKLISRCDNLIDIFLVASEFPSSFAAREAKPIIALRGVRIS